MQDEHQAAGERDPRSDAAEAPADEMLRASAQSREQCAHGDDEDQRADG
ncbi:hypothetical protein ISP_008056 [Amycolatopsis mediterranei]|uniref:Uncharacterized protein n=1 Tax=Amycolatopsis mediterranei (strain S699) TaxID=713604 RepID=A0A9R0P540_AMYMS|nr:hypothetical protein [Amycolatopsis mediterranei]AEK46493.1 hypothetical protein RAM_40130 [Amycolatopsis mediterranei S699]UZF74532.1 hypothetical protein ISP_008056 [Amycolatopsis mediterranei]